VEGHQRFQSPERLLGMVRLSRLSELPEQGGQVWLCLPKSDDFPAALPSAEERLVRRALVSLLSDTKVVEAR